ncbi:MAG: cell division protein ZapA [Parasporobacterium sp.]|nr:cell division protein ZapA [Parasporobacterium sp.]
MSVNYTDVVIDDKVYTVGSDQDSEYMQRVAAYVNDTLTSLRSQPGFNKQPYAGKQALILLNMADDYMRLKMQIEKLEKKYAEQESEYYRLKREMVNRKLEMDQLRLQNQVLSMGISGSDTAKDKLMADVIQSVRESENAIPSSTLPSSPPPLKKGMKKEDHK